MGDIISHRTRIEGEAPMAMKQFTRPDGSKIMINTSDIQSYAAVPASDSALGGASSIGTRLVLGGGHQDVLETVDEVTRILGG
jgi:hypothetical protein